MTIPIPTASVQFKDAELHKRTGPFVINASDFDENIHSIVRVSLSTASKGKGKEKDTSADGTENRAAAPVK